LSYILDTNVLIRLRDGDSVVAARVEALEGAVLMSIVSRVELEGGVHREQAIAGIRRRKLDEILAAIPTLAFGDVDADAYAAIVAGAGYSRRKILDRMIGAQALVQGASLVTMNATDYADVADLSIVDWSN